MAEIRGGGVGCCPPMDLMRSEPMQLVQVILPMESAHLGDLDLVQFKDEMISSWSKPFLESRFLILTQLTSAHVAQGEEKLSVHRAMLADGEPGFYKENQMMKCSPCYGRGLIALKDGSDSM